MAQSSGRTRFLTRLVKEKPLGTASGIAIVIVILVAVLADVIAPYPYGERHLPDRLQGSSAQYLLGTDYLGRDLLRNYRCFSHDHAGPGPVGSS